MLVPFLLLAFTVPLTSAAQADRSGCDSEGYLSRSSVAEEQGDYAVALALLDSAMLHAKADKDDDMVARALVRKGVMRQQLGDLDAGLSAFYQALGLRERLHDPIGLAEVDNNIGSIHQYQRNFNKAREYYGRSLGIYEQLGQRRDVAKAWNNYGTLYEDEGRPDSALVFHRRSLGIWEELGDEVWTALSFLHIGTCHEKLGQGDSARTYLQRSVSLLEQTNSPYLLSAARHTLGDHQRQAGDLQDALRWCGSALHGAEVLHAVPLEQKACECLYKTYEELGDEHQALVYYRRFVQ